MMCEVTKGDCKSFFGIVASSLWLRTIQCRKYPGVRGGGSSQSISPLSFTQPCYRTTTHSLVANFFTKSPASLPLTGSPRQFIVNTPRGYGTHLDAVFGSTSVGIFDILQLKPSMQNFSPLGPLSQEGNQVLAGMLATATNYH